MPLPVGAGVAAASTVAPAVGATATLATVGVWSALVVGAFGVILLVESDWETKTKAALEREANSRRYKCITCFKFPNEEFTEEIAALDSLKAQGKPLSVRVICRQNPLPTSRTCTFKEAQQ